MIYPSIYNERILFLIKLNFILKYDDRNNRWKLIKQKKRNKQQAKHLWNLFDVEILDKKIVKTNLECIYLSSKNRECCETCDSTLAITEEGFLECTNPKCSILYTDILDSTAEWRYYGADDNQQSDPTRCGMPINPLLEESSYGCKVICNSNSSYQMKKIRRYTEWQSMPYKEKSQYDEFQYIINMSQTPEFQK